jgi:hypothetical protein
MTTAPVTPAASRQAAVDAALLCGVVARGARVTSRSGRIAVGWCQQRQRRGLPIGRSSTVQRDIKNGCMANAPKPLEHANHPAPGQVRPVTWK